ncbi:MAG: hypothetical protein QOH86_2039, partial [Sphingomonadales bacterium]|nr:hypothetical protein [Sphingomonadales bacterium]
MSAQGRPRGGRALVIGAGLAGMCAARALQPFFAEIVLLEKDGETEAEAYRRGTPQAHFVHSLLERGRLELESLFPGFTEALRDRAVPLLDFGLDVAALRASGWMPRHSCGIQTYWPSRPVVDAIVSRLLGRVDGIEVLRNARVTGLEVADGRRHVSGVRVATRGGPTVLTADLVVDASGRGSALPRWLREAG